MSSLSVHDLQGIAAYSNTVRVPSGHKLSLDGELKLPTWTDSTRPASPDVGAIGFNTEQEVTEVYNGTEWISVGSSGALDGSSAEKAALSAAEIKTNFPTSQTGYYWIKTADMGTATQVYCDMSFDGGGWMLLAWGYVQATGNNNSNRNLPNLNHDGTTYSYNATARSSDHGIVTPNGSQQTAVKLTRASTQIMFAAGGNPASGGIDSYTYAYKAAIPSPSTTTFSNHSYDNTSGSTPTSSVSITGMKGESGTWTAYCFRDSIGVTWSDTYPTGYGFANSSGVRGWNSNGGPFFPSIHPGSSPRNNGNGWNSSPDVTNGHKIYNYRGWYGKDGGIGVNQTGQTSIWVK